MDNLIEYDGNSGMLNPMADRWRKRYVQGKEKLTGWKPTSVTLTERLRSMLPIHFRGARGFSLTSILHGIRINSTTGTGFLSISVISLMKDRRIRLMVIIIAETA